MLKSSDTYSEIRTTQNCTTDQLDYVATVLRQAADDLGKQIAEKKLSDARLSDYRIESSYSGFGAMFHMSLALGFTLEPKNRDLH